MKKEIKYRLIKHINFLEDELKDYKYFRALSKEEYFKERSKRRDIERWIENIINSSIDISKIILTNEGVSLPDSYRDIVALLSIIKDLKGIDAESLSKWVRFRNIIAHEYLDIRWNSIKKFIQETEVLYKNFLKGVKKYLGKI